MKSIQLLKLLFLPCAAFLWSSCLLPEDVISSGEFQPLKTLSISPGSAKVGDNIIITGENFISKKEYNQVWFYPNVKAVIDSVTKTQLFLKVPEGAVTGEIVVSNGVYTDTLKPNFTLIEISPFQNLGIEYNGLNVIRKTSGFYFTRPNGTPFLSYDTIELKANYTLQRTDRPHYQVFKDIGCFGDASYPDSIFQEFKYEKDYSKFSYKILKISIDAANLLITEAQIESQLKIRSLPNGGIYESCEKSLMILKKMPYQLINGKKSVKLSADQIAKSLESFTYNSSEFERAKSPSSSDYNRDKVILNIHEILPDAYFELTLE